MKKVYCVAVEDDSSGSVDYYCTLEGAKKAYEQECADFPNDEINLFEIEVADNATNDEIIGEADTAMWQRDYEPMRWRKGTNHSAKPHAKPPTD